MARKPRYLPRPGATVEITQRTMQGRFLMKPSKRFNALAAGCLARAQKNTGATVHAVAIMSTHFHALASFETVEQMSTFMCQFKANLSKAIGRLYDWPGSKFAGRYKAAPLSDEPGIHEERLEYVLSQVAKEGLVMSPRDWPGVHSANALAKSEPIPGIWVDRTKLFAARQKDKSVTEKDFTVEQNLHLEPLPHLAALSEAQQRSRIEEILERIETRTLEMHQRNHTAPIGAAAVLQRNPTDRAAWLPRSPQPTFHATGSVYRALMDGLREFVAAYRAAAERLRAGSLQVTFPENCYPPGLPFVQPG